MTIKEITYDVYNMYHKIEKADEYFYLALYDQEEVLALTAIKVIYKKKKKKKIFYAPNGIHMISPSPALLKVFENKMKLILKKEKVNACLTYVEKDFDIKKCGLVSLKVDDFKVIEDLNANNYFYIFKNKVSQLLF